MTVFRIHFTDGTTIDVEAENPANARKTAKERREGMITKIKVVKETTHA